jgi:hypothetical protein
MAFVNVSLLAGGALIVIPIVLHLIMRQRPKQLIFPALRFIQERRIANQRRLQLRHWLLLALRCAAIGLFALALTRPSVASAALSGWIATGLLAGGCLLTSLLALAAFARGVSRFLAGGFLTLAAILLLATLVTASRALAGRSPALGDQEAPVAAAIVLDTAPRMQYRHENKTRLAAAQEIAQWLVRQLPAESELAILDSRPGSGAFAVDRAAAVKSIDRLRPVPNPRPLTEALANAIQLVKQKTQARKEIYVFSDLTAAAWKLSVSGELKKLLSENRNVVLYVIDVGTDLPRNFALGELTLSGEVLTTGSDLTIQVQASASGTGGERTVELQLEQPDPKLPMLRDGKPVVPTLRLRGSQTVKLEPGSHQQVSFSVRGLESGVHQGLVRLVGEDGLALDDVRFFAVVVERAWPVLIVTPQSVSPRYLSEALAPFELRESGQARFRCDTIDQARLAQQELADYRAIALLDPSPLTPDEWNKLGEFCAGGGGLAIFLGAGAEPPVSFQDPAAVKVLGGKLSRQSRTPGDIYLAPRSYDHPILAGLRQQETSIPWNRFPVYYHWNLEELASTVRTIIPYGDGKPALVENRLSKGRVLVMTTPISDPPPRRPDGRPSWNELATGEDAWPCFVLVNEIFVYLAQSGQARLNVSAGETIVLPNDPAEFPERYQLFTPLDQPQDVLAKGDQVTVRFTDNPGAYRLRGQKNGPVVRGFAVNLPSDASDLTRLSRERLDELLGKGRYQLAKTREEIDRAVGNDRIGSEFYPLLITLLAVALGLEHVLANRFYRSKD